ncbi:Protein of unknown function DUF868 [Macleaya cordata]|uniref:DUF868 domain-containing protein n=1 Tax=Macleaya cordata TaxID=56857 RepID=A0A200RAI4_MACCD|nr:Protein of unknown function DUF868 [Macleaya cordata]
MMPVHHPFRIQSLPDPHSTGDKLTEDPMANKAAQCTVTCVYETKLIGACRRVIVVWSKNLINLSLSITVNSPGNENQCTCKIDFKPWHFWSKKGLKSFELEGKRVDVFWDLRSAKFPGGPEPSADYYVALVSDEEVVLLLGDLKKKAYKRTKSRPSLIDATLVYKKENIFGKKCFSTRAKFDQNNKREHDIVVENSLTGPRDPEMWISVDGIVLIHVTNLQWKFRGNETVMVNKTPVQVFWDVHDWLFGIPGSGHGMFIFRPGAPEYKPVNDGSSAGGSETGESSNDNGYLSCESRPTTADFSLFLYLWKIE